MALAAGARLGPYEILSLLGAGGMGEVWRARDVRVDRAVALKVLPEEFFESEERRKRFEREARLLASLNHPGIATLHSFEEVSSSASSSRHILVMELLEGETLRERLRGGPLPVRKAVDVAVQMAKALAAAHEKGIVHRDLKPENVFITKDDRVKILDFGLAKLSRREEAAGRDGVRPDRGGRRVRDGRIHVARAGAAASPWTIARTSSASARSSTRCCPGRIPSVARRRPRR